MAQIQRGLQMIEEAGEKPPVSEFDDHALWIQELNDYRIGEKYLKLPPESQQIVLVLLDEHTDWIKELTGMGAPDPATNPALAQTDAAQQAEAQAKSDVMQSGAQGPQPGSPNGPPGTHGPPMPPMQEPQITPPPGPGMPAGPPH